MNVMIFMGMCKIFIKSSDKVPVVAQFFLAESDRIDRNVDSELSHSILQKFQVDSALIL